MNLDKIFGKAEKVEEEKSLEVVVTEEIIIDEWLAYFDQTRSKFESQNISKSVEFFGLGSQYFVEYLKESMEFLEGYRAITPARISNFCNKVSSKKLTDMRKKDLGVFLSALIQSSYEQGNNCFDFENIDMHYFGSFLTGKSDNPIKIKAKIINGDSCLYFTNGCSFAVKRIKGDQSFASIKSCSVFAGTVIGNNCLSFAQDSKIEIRSYKIDSNLGILGMKNCQVYTPKIITFIKLNSVQSTIWNKSNDYHFGKLRTG